MGRQQGCRALVDFEETKPSATMSLLLENAADRPEEESFSIEELPLETFHDHLPYLPVSLGEPGGREFFVICALAFCRATFDDTADPRTCIHKWRHTNHGIKFHNLMRGDLVIWEVWMHVFPNQ